MQLNGKQRIRTFEVQSTYWFSRPAPSTTRTAYQIVPPGVEPGLSAPKADVIAITP